MWQLLTILLAAALAAVLARHLLLKRELGRLADTIGEIHSRSSNRQLTIGSQQPQLARLAEAVNTLYDDMDAERAANRATMDEMRQSMANISHDLRTPLTSILGYLKLLQGSGNTPQQQQHYLEVATRKAGALNGLVGGLFELARLESGGYTFQHQRLDAAALLAEELAAAYSQLEEKGLAPEVSLPTAPLWIIGDSGALARVYGNLLQNMIKHGTSPLRVSCGAESGTAVLRFANGAPELTQEDVAQLFQRFFTADRMRSGESTGLGLAIAKEFAEQMKGSMEAGLQNGILTFTLRLPLAAEG